MIKRNNHLEDDLQKSVFEYLRKAKPYLLAFAVPNGGKRNAREGARLKAQGVLAGVADILIFHNGSFYAVELKAGKNKQQKTQIAFMESWKEAGGKHAVCYSLDKFIGWLNSWEL